MYVISSNKDSFDVKAVSQNNIKSKVKERITFTHEFFKIYKEYTQSLQNSTRKFLTHEMSQGALEEIFVQSIDGLDCLHQLRVLDNDFNELLKVSGTPNTLRGKKYDTRVWAQNELTNKKSRGYTKIFGSLKEGELGISNMDNNVEFGKMTSNAVLRFGFKLFDHGKPIGYIISNICLKTFLNNVGKTTLYDVWIIDRSGTFLRYNDPKVQLLGNANPSTYKKITDLYPDANLNQEHTFLDDITFMSPLNGFNTDQGLRIVLHTKFAHDMFNEWELIVYIILLSLLIFGLIMSYFYGKRVNKINAQYMHNLFYDLDTGIRNRAKLIEDFQDNEDNVIILIKQDNIRQIMVVYGVEIADELLKKFARLLELSVKELGFQQLYRIDYGMFALTYTAKGDQEALIRTIERLHDTIELDELECGDDCSVHIEVTLGVSDINNIGNGHQELVEASLAIQKALITHKPYEVYSPLDSIIKGSTDSLDWIKRIKKSMREDLIRPVFQPIVNTQGEAIKYESLIRIVENETIYLPYQFLDIAKTSKHYMKLSQLMIESVFKTMATKPYNFSINISTLDIEDEEFLIFIIDMFEKYSVQDRLTVEILESESSIPVERLEGFLMTLKTYGVKVSIDDFGAGHSNFERLLELSGYVDYLKIDGSLIKNILTDKNSQILVRNIIVFSKELGLTTIAEFVENQEIFEYLQNLGIDYFQGYYFSKPVSIDQI
jgi:EAL domain-containing protein (putative c-di-GMP-specific phosphodiesterase class I)/GGDEF domain-containing protein